ncbi:MAG: transglutaminase domain-containing protein [bacterium]|nr:transglutaminase domain-containing protein [bacterium]
MKEKKQFMRYTILLLLLAAALVLFFFGTWKNDHVTVDIFKTEITKSNFDFIHEHWQEKQLFQLKEEENFKEIPAKSQWDLFLKLCDWTYKQWKVGNPDPYPLSNGIAILKEIRSGRTSGFCGQYAYVLADVLKSMGFFNVRYVELWSNKRKRKSHFAVEVWCDQYSKWVILDPTYHVYFQLADGVPANAFEIREALFGGPAVKTRSIGNDPKITDQHYMDYFANFAVSLRSDLLRHTTPLTTKDRFNMFLFYKDSRTKPGFYGEKIPYRLISQRKADLYYDCNTTAIEHVEDPVTGDVVLFFLTGGSTPNFRNFVISIDSGKTWQNLTGNRYRAAKQEGPFFLLVATVNMYGRPGHINKIHIQW